MEPEATSLLKICGIKQNVPATLWLFKAHLRRATPLWRVAVTICLLTPQRLDRIEQRCFFGGIDTEEEADNKGKEKRKEHRIQ